MRWRYRFACASRSANSSRKRNKLKNAVELESIGENEKFDLKSEGEGRANNAAEKKNKNEQIIY